MGYLIRKTYWRDGRVVDCGGLENRCTERYLGFESLSLRKMKEKLEHKVFKLFFVIQSVESLLS